MAEFMDETPRYAYTRCEECGGTGGWLPIDSFGEECDHCHGTGLLRVSHPDGNLFVIRPSGIPDTDDHG